MIKAEKKELVSKLVEEFGKLDSYYLADFTGITANDVSRLRAELRRQKAFMRVVKNRLLMKVFAQLNLDLPSSEVLKGSTAIIYSSGDVLEPARKVSEFSKDEVSIKFKGAFIEGRFLSEAEVVRLANIPTREVLLSELLGLFEGIKSALVGVLQAKLQELVLVIGSLREQKEEE